MPSFWLFWQKSSKSSYILHWHFDKKSCFVVVLVLNEWISTIQFDFLSQKLSVECNFSSNELFFAFLAFLAFLARNQFFFSLSREKWKVRENPRYKLNWISNIFGIRFGLLVAELILAFEVMVYKFYVLHYFSIFIIREQGEKVKLLPQLYICAMQHRNVRFL